MTGTPCWAKAGPETRKASPTRRPRMFPPLAAGADGWRQGPGQGPSATVLDIGSVGTRLCRRPRVAILRMIALWPSAAMRRAPPADDDRLRQIAVEGKGAAAGDSVRSCH